MVRRARKKTGSPDVLSEDTLFLSVGELGGLLRARKLSPVELAESYLARSEQLGPKLNAYANLTRELAMLQAHAAEKEIAAGDYRGPLHGVPYAVKDLVAVPGYPTTWGAPPYARQKLDFNATVIARLIQRIGSGCRRGSGALGNWFGHAWLHSLPHFLVRNFRHAAKFWTRQPP